MLRSRLLVAVSIATLLFAPVVPAQDMPVDKVDLAALTQIKSEAFQHSQAMESLFYISEVYGPRVNNSRNHRAAAEWAMQQLKSWGLQNVHLEKWGPFGDGWQIGKYYGALESPAYAALIGFPLAWTPGTNGPVTADAVLAPLHSEADFAKYKGKLKGKIVLIFDPRELTLHTEPESHRLTDEEVAARTRTPDPSHTGFGGGRPGAAAPRPGETPPPPSPPLRPPAASSATRSMPSSKKRASLWRSPPVTTATEAPSSPPTADRRTQGSRRPGGRRDPWGPAIRRRRRRWRLRRRCNRR